MVSDNSTRHRTEVTLRRKFRWRRGPHRGRQGSDRGALRSRPAVERARCFLVEIRSAGADPQSSDVRGLARCGRDCCSHDVSGPVRTIRRVCGLQRRGDRHSPVDRVVRELRRGAGGRARQGEGRLAAADQDGVDGQTSSDLRAKSSRCRRRVLRKEDVVRVDKGEIIPTDGEVIEGVAYVNESAITGESAPVLKEPGTDMFSSVTAGTSLISDSLAHPRHRQSGRKLPRPHDPSRGRRQAAENPERDGPDRPARHIDPDLRHRGGRHGAGRGLPAGAGSTSPI